jgi:hypothetical protein
MGLENIKIDGGLVAFIIAACGAAWGGLMGIFSLKGRVDAHDIRLKNHNDKMLEIEAHMDDAHGDFKAALIRAEGKLDMLIVKLIPPPRGSNHES